MSAVHFLIIKILLFNNIFFTYSSVLNLESKEDQVEGSGLVLFDNENNLNFTTDFESNLLRKIEKTLDLIVTTRINLIEEKFKSYIQTEIQTLKAPKSDLDDKCSKDEYPDSCYAIKECRNFVFSIMVKSFSNKPFKAACDFETLNGGWTVIQRRQDGSENFFRNWSDYVNGFGDVHGEFFIGLEKLHALTSNGPPQELYIIMEDFEGTRKYATYSKFIVGSENTDFELSVGGYSGDAGDSLEYDDGLTFSTKDYGQASECALKSKGGWWYKDCNKGNLNGLYLLGKYSKSKYGEGVNWGDFRGNYYSLKFVQMMIRPPLPYDD